MTCPGHFLRYACHARGRFSQGLIIERGAGAEEDAVAVGEGMAVDAHALVGDAVEAIDIFDQPGAIAPAQAGVEAGDAARGNLYIVAGQASNRHYRLVELPLTDDLPVDLHAQARSRHALFASLPPRRHCPGAIAALPIEPVCRRCHRHAGGRWPVAW